jgi:hypothetical protein
MKKNCYPLAAFKSLAALFTVGVLCLYAVPRASAADTTNAQVKPDKHGLSLKVDAGAEESFKTNYFGLPKEAFDKLTPEQIVELAKSHEPPAAMLIALPIAMFAMIIGCVALGVSGKLKRAKLQHETLRLMIEKGQPIPPEMFYSSSGLRARRNDLLTGLILVGVGLGLGIFLFLVGGDGWPLAFIPLLIGVAFLVARQIEKSSNGQPK